MSHHTIRSADGTTIAFDRYGEGPAVVLVGGAFQTRAGDPRTQDLARLIAAEGFTVVHYERRGRGDSGDTAPYAPERELEDLAALAGDRAHLFGMSSGGAIVLDAARAGLPVASAAVFELSILVDDSRPPVPRDYLARLRARVAAGDRDAAVRQFLAEAVELPAEAIDGMAHAPFWPAMAAVAHTLPYDGAFVEGLMYGDPDAPRARWADVTTPTLVADGGASPPFFASGADALARALPGGTRVTLPEQTHDVDPEVLAPALTGFFRAHT